MEERKSERGMPILKSSLSISTKIAVSDNWISYLLGRYAQSINMYSYLYVYDCMCICVKKKSTCTKTAVLVDSQDPSHVLFSRCCCRFCLLNLPISNCVWRSPLVSVREYWERHRQQIHTHAHTRPNIYTASPKINLLQIINYQLSNSLHFHFVFQIEKKEIFVIVTEAAEHIFPYHFVILCNFVSIRDAGERAALCGCVKVR